MGGATAPLAFVSNMNISTHRTPSPWLPLLIALGLGVGFGWLLRDQTQPQLQTSRPPAEAPIASDALQPSATIKPLADTRARISPTYAPTHVDHEKREANLQGNPYEAVLSRRFNSESTDAPWASRKITELRSMASSSQIAALGAEVSNLSVDCRQATCRMTGDFATRSAAEDWVTLYMSSLGNRLPSATYRLHEAPGGRTGIEIYGAAR